MQRYSENCVRAPQASRGLAGAREACCCATRVRGGVGAGGCALLATSPDAVWWGGALAVALTGAGLLRLGDRIPDPLLQAQCPPPRAVSAADPG